jgi:hypothetical protein
MALVRTEWSPDTCGCTLAYEWDRDVPAEERTHIHVETVVRCEHHVHLPDPESYEAERHASAEWSAEAHTVWHAVHEENLRKNRTEFHALEVVEGELSHRAEGGGLHWLPDSWLGLDAAHREALLIVARPQTRYEWSFDGERVLHVRIQGAADEHHSVLQSRVDANFGGGRVRVG